MILLGVVGILVLTLVGLGFLFYDILTGQRRIPMRNPFVVLLLAILFGKQP